MAVIEAKRSTLNPADAAAQGQAYAKQTRRAFHLSLERQRDPVLRFHVQEIVEYVYPVILRERVLERSQRTIESHVSYNVQAERFVFEPALP
jgi:hypothetical protein